MSDAYPSDAGTKTHERTVRRQLVAGWICMAAGVVTAILSTLAVWRYALTETAAILSGAGVGAATPAASAGDLFDLWLFVVLDGPQVLAAESPAAFVAAVVCLASGAAIAGNAYGWVLRE